MRLKSAVRITDTIAGVVPCHVTVNEYCGIRRHRKKKGKRKTGFIRKRSAAGPVIPDSKTGSHGLMHTVHRRERGQLDDVHTRSSPRGFHAPNPLSSIHSTIFTIRHPSQCTHTTSHRQWLDQPEVRFCHLQDPPNIVSKYKERKSGRQLLLFGDAVDAEGGARSQAKTPWEGDVLLNFDALVSLG